MDTTPHPRTPRRRRAQAARDTGRERRTAQDAYWWVVLYQGALDYTRSTGGTDRDAEAATRLVESYPAVRRQ
jgi:hypothetical protein